MHTCSPIYQNIITFLSKIRYQNHKYGSKFRRNEQVKLKVKSNIYINLLIIKYNNNIEGILKNLQLIKNL